MRTLLTSDIHFFHKNIIAYCARPYFDEYDMNQRIAGRWGQQALPDDRIIFVGDLSAGLQGRQADLSKIIKDLPGRKTLVRGNHDHMPDAWYLDAGFESVVPWLWEDGILYIHKPATAGNDETLDLMAKCDPKLIIHGHIHSKQNGQIPGHYNVAWDWHGGLVNLTEIIRECNL
jgi:calcineurin-like phosphoesterase family protein